MYDFDEIEIVPSVLAGEVHWAAKIPVFALLIPMVAAWIMMVFQGGMARWGVSSTSIGNGHYENLFLHMFAHGGLLHLLMNASALHALGGPLVMRMGAFPRSWFGFFGVYFFAGLAGAAGYLLVHPAGEVPMVGASGAICGLLGVVSRMTFVPGELLPISSTEFRQRAWLFVKENLLLILLFTVPVLLLGKQGGVAWEAHVGGFLVGLVLAPFVLKLANEMPPAAPSDVGS